MMTGVPLFRMVADPKNTPSRSYSVSGASAVGSCCQCTRSVEATWPQCGRSHVGASGLYW